MPHSWFISTYDLNHHANFLAPPEANICRWDILHSPFTASRAPYRVASYWSSQHSLVFCITTNVGT